MNEETREFLLECKKAGYEFIAICIEDKRVPISVKLEKVGERKYGKSPSGGEYWGQAKLTKDDGEVIEIRPPTIICASPNCRKSGFPAIWKICTDSPITAGMLFRGTGCGESHNIRTNHGLDRGCYDLKELN